MLYHMVREGRSCTDLVSFLDGCSINNVGPHATLGAHQHFDRLVEGTTDIPASEAVAVDKLDRATAPTGRVESMRVIVQTDSTALGFVCEQRVG